VPNFTESIPGILTSLGGRPRPVARWTNRDLEPGTFPAIAIAFLSRLGDEKAVNAAIEVLQESGLTDPRALAESDSAELEDLLRAAGARTVVKAMAPLRKLARWYADKFDGSVDASTATELMRDDLRSLNGIGPTSADAILLNGFARAAYPVDRATYRILVRHGWIDPSAEYDEVRSLIEGALGYEPMDLSMISGEFEELGRLTCRPSVAKCDRCPLRDFLPEGGPLGDQ